MPKNEQVFTIFCVHVLRFKHSCRMLLLHRTNRLCDTVIRHKSKLQFFHVLKILWLKSMFMFFFTFVSVAARRMVDVN
jgi:hypothetical protein